MLRGISISSFINNNLLKGIKYKILFIQISSAKYRIGPLEFTIIYAIFEQWTNL